MERETTKKLRACRVHPERPAVAWCRSCSQSTCEACTVLVDGLTPRCRACLARESRGKWWLLGSLPLVAACVAAAWFLLGRGAPQPAALSRGFDYGAATSDVERLRAELAQEPCDRGRVVALGQALIQAGDNRGCLRAADAFLKKCGEHPRLRWLTYEAHKRLSEWSQAAAEASKLIAAEPEDPSFRAWRGAISEHTGDWAGAAEDYRQALLLRPDLHDVPLTLANVYGKLGKPCDGIMPLAQLMFVTKDAPTLARVKARMHELEARSDCSWSVGQGQARFERSPHRDVFLARVRVNDAAVGEFVIDTGATLVVLSRALANKLKLDLNQAPLLLAQTANGVSSGPGAILSQVSVQGLSAKQVRPSSATASAPSTVCSA